MAEHYAIAIDIGTSGIRAQSYNLTTHKTISTAITLRHPLPGANVVDHLHFALNIGRETAHNILITTINRHHIHYINIRFLNISLLVNLQINLL